jgi:hypothetical protein
MSRIILSVLACLALAATAQAGGLAPSKGSQLIEVTALPSSATCPSGGKAFDVLDNYDGTTSPFSIPSGKILVITDVSMLAGGYISVGLAEFQLRRETASSSNVIVDVAVPGSLNNVTSGGTSAAYFTFPTGVRTQSGVQLCVKTIANGMATFTRATAHGFLAPDK